MILNENFILKEINEEMMIIPVSQEAVNSNAIYKLNSIGSLVFKSLIDNLSEDSIVNLIANDYDADTDTIRKDVRMIIKDFLEKGIFL